MPLLDHFNAPLSRTHPWRGFHGAWASAMARMLNGGVLPEGFYAVPFLDREGPIEIDVAALREPGNLGNTADLRQPWSPASPGLTIAVEWPTSDDVRVEVFADDGDPALRAAVELVSPSNKDRPKSRAAFAAKCAGYLRLGCGLVVIDVVTTRRANLHADLLNELEVDATRTSEGDLSVISYRPVGRDNTGQLLGWPTWLRVGEPLPTVPLWLGDDLAVPLDLDATHRAACDDLRIRPFDKIDAN